MTIDVSSKDPKVGGLDLSSPGTKALGDKEKAANEQLEEMLGSMSPGVSLDDSISQMVEAQRLQVRTTTVVNVATAMSSMLKKIADGIVVR